MHRLNAWMIAQRDFVPDRSAISRALDYSLKRWTALSRDLDDGGPYPVMMIEPRTKSGHGL
jgi:hypothetical protein